MSDSVSSRTLGIFLGNKLLYERNVPFEKIVARQLFASHPNCLSKIQIASLSVILRHSVEQQMNHRPLAVPKVVACHFHADFSVDTKFLRQLAFERGGRIFSCFHLAARKFPF